jgi:hypothetical protein
MYTTLGTVANRDMSYQNQVKNLTKGETTETDNPHPTMIFIRRLRREDLESPP